MEINRSRSTKQPAPQTARQVEDREQAAARPLFNWAVALGGLWLILGLHLDGWAHHHVALESFFTPWHGVLYSGYAFTAATVGLAFLRGLRSGSGLRAALLPAYRTSLIGALMFFFGGVADMTWHTLFGIEQSLEALLSPPHLFLAVGGGLLVTGPLREALYRRGSGSAVGATPAAANDRPSLPWPALLSLTVLVALITFFTAYVHPWIEASEPNSSTFLGFLPGFRSIGLGQAHLVAGVLLQTAILMFAVLLVLRRFRLPFGALMVLIALPVMLGASMHQNWGLFPLALAGGLAAEGLLLLLRPSSARAGSARLFAFLAPLALYTIYFAAFKLTGQLNWSFELWGGTVILAGVTGWLLSYAFFPAE